MKTKILKTCRTLTRHKSELGNLVDLCKSSPEEDVALLEAAESLRRGEVVAFPTETVYGLGANACNSDAVQKIYMAKGRPSDNPLIVHVSSLKMLKELIIGDDGLGECDMSWIPTIYQSLIKSFWPGPLTLLFPYTAPKTSRLRLAYITLAGQDTVGVRFPSHPIAQNLISLANVPIAAPSANLSGKPSPTNPEHVYEDLQGRIPIIVAPFDKTDGCHVGVESTVLDGGFRTMSVSAKGPLGPVPSPRILRPGGTTLEQIQEAWHRDGRDVCIEAAQKIDVYRKGTDVNGVESHPRTPGMKYRHYAPKATVYILEHSESDIIINDTLLAFLNAELNHTSHHVTKIGVLDLESGGLEHTLLGLLTRQRIHEVQVIPFTFAVPHESHQAEAAGQNLYTGLRHLDEQGCDLILVAALADESGLGAAVMERVRKAAESAIAAVVPAISADSVR